MIPFLFLGFTGGKYSSFSGNCKVEIAKLYFYLSKFVLHLQGGALPMRGEVHQVMVIGTGFCRFVKVIFLLFREGLLVITGTIETKKLSYFN
jgi:hypothetical protein